MPDLMRRWLPLVLLGALSSLVLLLLRPPQPLPATAPASEFAAGRTVADLDSLARGPHPLGSAAHARTRAYLLRRLQALGLRPRVQDTTVLLHWRNRPLLAHVQNVLATMPGQRPGAKAVLVLTHYDSQPHAAGAGDDAAGVAAALETIRALRTGPPLANPVTWLFTDGEELGLLGAQAFAADSARLRRQVGVALNFEGRGNSGPSLLFEVSAGNGALVRTYAQTVPAPAASSLFYDAYRLLPNYTDFTVLRRAGVPGLNFAFIGGLPYYHSPADTPDRLSLASVQHHGSAMLSLARRFGNAELPLATAPDATFFSLFNAVVVRYPVGWTWPLVGVAALLLGLVAAVAQQQRRLRWAGLLGGALASLGGMGLLLGAGWLFLLGVRAMYPQYLAFYSGTFYNALAYQVALLALGGALGCWYYLLLSRWLRFDSLVGGALLLGLLLAGALAWVAPTSAYVLTWPVLAATLAWGLGQLNLGRQTPGQFGTVADCLLSLPLVLLLVPVLGLLLPTFGLGTPVLAVMGLLALMLGLLLPLVLPALRQPERLRSSAASRAKTSLVLPLLGLAVGAGALVWGHLTSQPTPLQPQQTHLYYYLDAAARQAYWLSEQPHADAWLRNVLPAATVGSKPNDVPGTPAQWAPAPTLPLGLPSAQVLTDSVWAGRRHLRLLVQAGLAGSTGLRLRQAALTSRSPLALRVAGQVVPPTSLAAPGLQLLGLSSATVEVELPANAPWQLVVRSQALGLPAAAGLPPLPATYVPAPGYTSFTTQVQQTIELPAPPQPQPPAQPSALPTPTRPIPKRAIWVRPRAWASKKASPVTGKPFQ